MKEPIVHAIFPTPIYFSILSKDFTSSELKFVDLNKKKTYKNEGNVTSEDFYVLNKKPFKRIKKDLQNMVEDYFNKIIQTEDKIKPYITQSWLNFTKTSEFHHKHSHPNSLVSGVLYFDCDENFDKIIFFKPQTHSTIVPTIKTPNYWNAGSWFFSVKTNNVVLFPSTLEHMVENKQGDNLRISLAFNVFIKGAVGEERKLTKLFL